MELFGKLLTAGQSILDIDRDMNTPLNYKHNSDTYSANSAMKELDEYVEFIQNQIQERNMKNKKTC